MNDSERGKNLRTGREYKGVRCRCWIALISLLPVLWGAFCPLPHQLFIRFNQDVVLSSTTVQQWKEQSFFTGGLIWEDTPASIVSKTGKTLQISVYEYAVFSQGGLFDAEDSFLLPFQTFSDPGGLLLNQKAAEQLFGTNKAAGAEVFLNGEPVTVVEAIRRKTASGIENADLYAFRPARENARIRYALLFASDQTAVETAYLFVKRQLKTEGISASILNLDAVWHCVRTICRLITGISVIWLGRGLRKSKRILRAGICMLGGYIMASGLYLPSYWMPSKILMPQLLETVQSIIRHLNNEQYPVHPLTMRPIWISLIALMLSHWIMYLLYSIRVRLLQRTRGGIE